METIAVAKLGITFSFKSYTEIGLLRKLLCEERERLWRERYGDVLDRYTFDEVKELREEMFKPFDYDNHCAAQGPGPHPGIIVGTLLDRIDKLEANLQKRLAKDTK